MAINTSQETLNKLYRLRRGTDIVIQLKGERREIDIDGTITSIPDDVDDSEFILETVKIYLKDKGE